MSGKEKTFYNAEELKEFESLLRTKLEEAQEEAKKLSTSLRENTGHASDSYNITDYGGEGQEKEETEILLARQEKFIANLEKALFRIKNGTYGICKVTGKLIPRERLLVVPHTTTSIEGKRMLENK